MLQDAIDSQSSFGLTFKKYQNLRHSKRLLTHNDYADNRAVIFDTIKDVEKLLRCIEIIAKTVVLNVNARKIEFISFNQGGSICCLDWNKIWQVKDFAYLGSYTHSIDKGLEIRKSKAWSALNKFTCIWKLNLLDNPKCQFFKPNVASILCMGQHHVHWHENKSNLQMGH